MLSRRKFESISFFLPLIGAILIMPPLVLVFDVPHRVFGVPAVLAFLFGVWLALIVATFLLRRSAMDADAPPPGADQDRWTR